MQAMVWTRLSRGAFKGGKYTRVAVGCRFFSASHDADVVVIGSGPGTLCVFFSSRH